MMGNGTLYENEIEREVFNFNTDWLFYRGDIYKEMVDDTCWERVILPHTVRLEPKEWKDSPSYQGISWYRRYFTLDQTLIKKKIFIRFEGVMINAEVWVNGQHVCSHYGGYLPFTIDVTETVMLGKQNIIEVKVDSNDDGETPPGKPQKELDFVYFGGLYRHVQLIVTNPLHITDAVYANKVASGGVFITYPEVDEQRAKIQIQTHVQNDEKTMKEIYAEAKILDKETQTIVAEGKSNKISLRAESDETFVQTLTIDRPKLWSMDHPNLYIMLIQVKEGNQLRDTYQEQIGIRNITFTAKNGFYINGKRILLNGVNYHEDFLYVGNAVSNSMLYRDVKMIKEAGFNFIRTGHYPQNQAFINACDELGIAVIVPTPGWQYYTDKGDFETRSLQMTREMIRLYRNHPSVIVWEPVLNETWYPKEFAQKAYQAVHEEYPTNQAIAASDFGAPYGKHFDVVYKEAYSETKPLITREWGDANHNLLDGERSARKFGEKSLIQASLHRQNSLKGNKWKNDEEEDGYWDWAGLNANQRISGYALWSYNDYNRGLSQEIAHSGIVDRDRYPKFNYYWFQSQKSPSANHKPMIFIANYGLESSPRDLHIYTNTDEVKLYRNQKYIGTKKPPNIDHIRHPIIVFHDIPWEEGELRAEGFINERLVATHTINTPGKPNHLSVEFVTNGVEELIANGSDMMMAYISIRDQHGQLVPTANHSISLHLSGPGQLIGNEDGRVEANPVRAEAGIGPAFIRSTLTPGILTLTATAPGLQSGEAEINSIPYGGKYISGGDDGGNLLLLNKKTVSFMCLTVSSEQIDHKGSSINNEYQESYWLPDKMDPTPWIMIDLEEKMNLIGSKILWSSNKSPKKYKLEVSEDQKDWIAVVNRSENERTEQTQLEYFASNTRYVRLSLCSSSVGCEGIVDFQLFVGRGSTKHPLRPKQRVNIAVGKTALASSFTPGNEPENAVNQNAQTLWQAGTYNLPQWLQINLDNEESISGAKILWGKDSTHYAYKIQVSKDEQRWVDVVSKTSTGSYYHPIDFEVHSIKYIRIYVYDLMAGGGLEKVAIKKLEVYRNA
ncbi:discoidin domain-containing protein [Lederbergia sp. NSJ-179]|uniref:discoidin domain-containing protein n=1 Tax=Lederbergia sp. NSJ-179 TaxID=2931402 RepID=UPI001FD073E0|nr:discoidin domain-containing protein [Lederbergia sp. NSJ-179]MCJ7842111.1 discoidin domain-containing protein [Lederbergia sp. NSJ-179]